MFPLPPLIYLSLTGWTLYFFVANRPLEVIFSAAIVLSGIIFTLFLQKEVNNPNQSIWRHSSRLIFLYLLLHNLNPNKYL